MILTPLVCHSLQKNTFPPIFYFGLFHIEADPTRKGDDPSFCVYDAILYIPRVRDHLVLDTLAQIVCCPEFGIHFLVEIYPQRSVIST